MKTQTDDLCDIVSRLLTFEPYRIVLFGSKASGTENADSDIDLLVILDSEAISQTYRERMRRRLMVRDRLREINRRVPIDLLIYTKAEYELLRRHGTSFCCEIESSGKTLYEKAKFCESAGYQTPILCTPLELMEEETYEMGPNR